MGGWTVRGGVLRSGWDFRRDEGLAMLGKVSVTLLGRLFRPLGFGLLVNCCFLCFDTMCERDEDFGGMRI